MENQLQSSQQMSPLPIDRDMVSKAKANFLLIFTSVLITAVVFGAGGYYFGSTNEQSVANEISSKGTEQSDVQVSPAPVASDDAVVTPSIKTKWDSYTNPNVLYEVSYPTGWRIQKYDHGEGYGPVEIQEDVLWAINFYSRDNYTLEEIAAEFGKQFDDREQTKEEITVNNIPATKFITATPSIPDWYLVNVVFERGTNYIVLSNGAISDENLQQMEGVAPNTTFGRFYKSFHFVD